MQRQMVRDELYPLLDKTLFAVFVLLLPFALGSGAKLFGDGDVSWHIAAGRWILEHRAVPATDPFSFTMGGQPWIAFEWLSQVIYALAYNAAGHSGQATVVITAFMVLHLVVFLFLRRRVGPLAMLIALAAMDVILTFFVLARPHVLVWPIIAAWTVVLLNCRDQNRTPPLALALLMLLWTNLHGSFVLGFAIAGAVGLDTLVAAKWERRVFASWLLFALVALLAALLNANGIAGFLHPFTVMGLENLKFIGEWQPSTPSRTPLFYAILIGTMGALLIRGIKLAFGEVLLLLFLLILAFSQMRHQSWLAIVAVLILAPRLAPRGRGETTQMFSTAANRRMWLASAATAAIAILTLRLALPLRPQDNMANPHKLLTQIPAELKSQPVFNEYTFGGPLMLAGVRPYIDGRSDMYGDAFMSEYMKIDDGDLVLFNDAVRKYGITWTMLPPKVRLTKALDASPDWRRLYGDSVGVIHVRESRLVIHAQNGTSDKPLPSRSQH